MSDMPERIWAVHHETQGSIRIGEWGDTIRHIGGTEYVRADLAIPTVTLPDDVAGVVEKLGMIHEWKVGKAAASIITAQAAEIEGLQRTYDELYSDALADAKSDAQDFESDLWAMVRGYLDELHFDWCDFMEDGVTADEAVGHIRECMNEETRRAEAAEAKLADAEKELDSTKEIGILAIEVAEAHIATLTAQVEAMRRALEKLGQEPQEGELMVPFIRRNVAIARAALTTENQTNG